MKLSEQGLIVYRTMLDQSDFLKKGSNGRLQIIWYSFM
jgi:hypothetical protein